MNKGSYPFQLPSEYDQELLRGDHIIRFKI